MASETQYVDELIRAEQEAQKIIQAAEKERERKLKGARDAAERDIDLFRQQKEAEYAKLQGSKEDKEFEQKLKLETEADIKKIFGDFEKNKDRVVDLLIRNALNVDLSIPQTIKEKFSKRK